MWKAIIPIGGQGSRWNNHTGVPKYKAEVDGEPILDRTIRLLRQYDVEATLIKDGETTYGDIDKIYSSRKKWSKDDKTVILFGDTFFTDEAMEKIMTNQSTKWTVYGRVMGSPFTGKEYGELYGVSFYPESIGHMVECIERVAKLHDRGAIDSANLWALYRAMHNFPDDLMNSHFAGTDFVEINDFTEDFDWPQDYDKFIERWENK
jgi:hypothetical protein